VGMTLNVTPVVTNENTVYLKLDLTRSTKAASDAGKTSSNAKTEMFVKSGLTAVVGGIYESSQDDLATGVPGLRQIPVLGKLFEASDKITNKNELMMFITPTILRPL
ncbi:MAG: type II and III secretion system protein, partial [Bdellovibrionaceae bacterium]|nr:type II and III secretion system protein [Pseudobdellovibrionaceae bacterium]